jgi:hypothetical protein
MSKADNYLELLLYDKRVQFSTNDRFIANNFVHTLSLRCGQSFFFACQDYCKKLCFNLLYIYLLRS